MGILICGLNGSGKSTMGKLLAERLSYQFIDNEDLYFPKTDTTYLFSTPRSKEDVIGILEEMIENNPRFVFSAVRGDYGEKLLSQLDAVVLIDVPKEIRLQRVRNRSFQKFGNRMLPGGDLFEKENAFFETVSSRPEDFVISWLQAVKCPVIRVDGTLPVEENVEYLLSLYHPVNRST